MEAYHCIESLYSRNKSSANLPYLSVAAVTERRELQALLQAMDLQIVANLQYREIVSYQ